jgi:hypothetical protein
VGAWKNILDPDPEKRSANLNYVIDRMRLVDEVGARCCVDIAGSFNPNIWYGPDPKNLSAEFFDATVENCRKIIDHVKPRHSKFSIEMMPWSLPDGPDTYLKLIQAVGRSAFGVHMDDCNAINSPARFWERAQNGHGVKHATLNTSEFLSRLVARSLALCAFEERAQNGHGVKHATQNTSEFLSRLVARSRVLCASTAMAS